MTTSWPLSRLQIPDASGRPLLVPSVQFFAAGTTDPLDVFKDSARTIPHEQPVKADAFGKFPRIYLPALLYAEEVRGPYDNLLWRDDGLGYVPATQTDTGGGAVDPTAVASTGDIKWRLDPGILPGWVRMNARTLGSAISGATELADVSTQALYVYLWQNFSDAIAPVTSGRGTAALADFNAGKPIGIPTMQGLVAAGLDDMGSTAANRLQVSANLTLSAGSITATVSNPAGIAPNMTIVGDGIPANTIVVDIGGTTVTMSNPAGAGSTGTVPARFSVFADAQTPGQIGGDTVRTLSNANLPPAFPSGLVTVTYPAHGYKRSGEGNQGTKNGDGTVVNVNLGSVDAATTPPDPVDHPVAIANPNGGRPFPTVQPSRLGTFYMKL
ncbi:hypothetical protein [Methylobacterium brachythecii]|uniref:Uncharacterized protein n=1 Tax=Methylobacterium brachythecii TaxID=1176177 RepID=A0A7W6F955_9HYPH|nr:hypothetical protein [Methylobacterium brachythecii]MBB3905135.1 hypothetical protein [Methylobacterium brachythecii]GLS44358.1 hypothetical protein GCM10007884_23460 [Methylobacterium brachythecii]